MEWLRLIWTNSISLLFTGWLDDGLFIQREGDKRGGSSGIKGLGSGSNTGENDGRRNVLWNNFSSNHAFTTGRQQRQNDVNFGGKVRPKGPSQTLKVFKYSFIFCC